MDIQNLKINILPAYDGDCIHLRFYLLAHDDAKPEKRAERMQEQEDETPPEADKYRCVNVVIDSGPSDHADGFTRLMHSIRDAGEKVDLLCFTHVDDDHIQAAEKFFGNPVASLRARDYIEKVWINIPQYETEKAVEKKPSHNEKLSPRRAVDLYSYLLWHKIPCETWVSAGRTERYESAVIRVVLPTDKRLGEYEAWWKTKRPNDQLAATAPQDPSKSNGSSIALLVEVFGSKLLFAGDAYADDLEAAAQTYAASGLDMVKLPHHGSRRNTSETMLEQMKCSCFVISGDGSQKQLDKKRPSLDALELVNGYGMREGAVTLYGNYDWDYVSAWVRDDHVTGVNIIKLDHKPIQISDKIEIRTEPMG